MLYAIRQNPRPVLLRSFAFYAKEDCRLSLDSTFNEESIAKGMGTVKHF